MSLVGLCLLAMVPARAAAGHPLETDDPGTQGDGLASVETSVGLVLNGSPTLELGLAGAVGLGDEVDLAIAIAGEVAMDAQGPAGSLAPALSLKWRALGGQGWALGVRLDAGLETPSLGGVLLVAVGAPLTLLVSVGPSGALGDGEPTWALSGSTALSCALGEWALSAELAGDLDEGLALHVRTQLAAAWSPTATDTLSVGVASALPLEDDAAQWTFRVGWTVVLRPTG